MGERRERIRSKLIKYFWITLTATVAVFTVIVSVRTVRDMIKTGQRRVATEQRIGQLERQIARDSIFIHQLSTSPDFLEKFAREQYLMQRPGETVYILEE